MHWIIILIYGLALVFVFLYSLIQLYLVFSYRKTKGEHPVEADQITDKNLPKVTVQLPIFNEKYVVERLLESISNLSYPKDKLQIQLLDDSTDECKEIARRKVNELESLDFDIQYIHRENREGYKAGALAAALPLAKGELIAIFDADFCPSPDFLLKLIPHFSESKVGMVQSRWAHLNQNYSLLTKLQAFGLDAHFSVEQGGRNRGNHFINFNGTAGIWRKECILDAGGWESDTLTEDLDLSYRAQLKGWQFIFREDVESPAELPAEINALKTQQYRWNKGAAECMRKNLPKVLKSSNFNWLTKLNAVFHLMNSAIFISVILLALLSIPMMYIKRDHPELDSLFTIAGFFLISLPILAFFYWNSENRMGKAKLLWFVLKFPSFLSVSMGLSLHNAIAVSEGYLGKKSPFVRTPKFNIDDRGKNSISTNVYLKKALNPLVILELIFALYFFTGIILAFHLHDYGLLPFHIFLFFGFAYISVISFWHAAKFYK